MKTTYINPILVRVVHILHRVEAPLAIPRLPTSLRVQGLQVANVWRAVAEDVGGVVHRWVFSRYHEEAERTIGDCGHQGH